MYSPAYTLLGLSFVFLLSLSSKGLKIISNSSTTSVDDVLYISWHVNPRLHGNLSRTVNFQVKFCPLNIYLEPEDCHGVNVTLCNATYKTQPRIFGNISTREDEFAHFLLRDGYHDIFLKNVSASVSSEWNETSSQFTCAVHNLDACELACPAVIANVKGQVELSAWMGDENEKQLLNITKNQEPSQHLKKPTDIVLVQNNRYAVTVKWKACTYDNPVGFNIIFHEHGGNKTSCGPKLNKEYIGFRNWEYTCKFSHLRPFTYYTVSVYPYHVYDVKLRSLAFAATKTFRTLEQAPSRPPVIECVMCNEKLLDDGNRMVTVRWKLPPKDTFNGVVRQTMMRYWEKDDFENGTKTITYDNATLRGSVKLKANTEYFVQVKICTLVNHCSSFTDRKAILKVDKNHFTGNTVTFQGLNTGSVSAIVSAAIFFLVFTALILGFMYWRKQRKRRVVQKSHLEDLKLPPNIEDSFNNDMKDKLAFASSKESLQSTEYQELPPDGLEGEYVNALKSGEPEV